MGVTEGRTKALTLNVPSQRAGHNTPLVRHGLAQCLQQSADFDCALSD